MISRRKSRRLVRDTSDTYHGYSILHLMPLTDDTLPIMCRDDLLTHKENVLNADSIDRELKSRFNLYLELLDYLSLSKCNESDIEYVKIGNAYVDWSIFVEKAKNIIYTNSIKTNFLIMGKNWYYDCVGDWKFHKIPEKPEFCINTVFSELDIL